MSGVVIFFSYLKCIGKDLEEIGVSIREIGLIRLRIGNVGEPL